MIIINFKHLILTVVQFIVFLLKHTYSRCSHGYERDTSISEEVVCIKEGSCDCDENGSYGKECGDNGQCKCKVS